jgi:hypothetical protein
MSASCGHRIDSDGHTRGYTRSLRRAHWAAQEGGHVVGEPSTLLIATLIVAAASIATARILPTGIICLWTWFALTWRTRVRLRVAWRLSCIFTARLLTLTRLLAARLARRSPIALTTRPLIATRLALRLCVGGRAIVAGSCRYGWHRSIRNRLFA